MSRFYEPAQRISMQRLDKILCDLQIGTRSEVKKLIAKGQVQVNGEVLLRPETRIDETSAQITCCGKPYRFQKYQYLMLNKPAGVVSAREDRKEQTVLDLIESPVKDLSPVGRLDKDTVGLMLLTNDGALSHRLLSPRRHVAKTYEVTLQQPITKDQVSVLETGVDIGDEELTMPAHVKILNDTVIELSIREGRFHQVKRMLEAVGNRVIHLKRLRMGGLYLDETLAEGAYRNLTEEELLSLQEETPSLEGIEAVIFDVDGSLCDSMWLWKQIDIDYLAKFDLPLPDSLQSEIEGMSFYQTAVYMKERFAIPDSIEEMMKDWNEMAGTYYQTQVELKPGAKEFLGLCKDRGIKLAVATSNSRELFSHLIVHHGLDAYLSVIKTGSEVVNGKPAPDIYVSAAKDLGVSPEKCLVFEDIIPGIKAGKAAGMKVCAVRDLYSIDQDLEKHRLADYYIEDFYQITDRYGAYGDTPERRNYV